MAGVVEGGTAEIKGTAFEECAINKESGLGGAVQATLLPGGSIQIGEEEKEMEKPEKEERRLRDKGEETALPGTSFIKNTANQCGAIALVFVTGDETGEESVVKLVNIDCGSDTSANTPSEGRNVFVMGSDVLALLSPHTFPALAESEEKGISEEQAVGCSGADGAKWQLSLSPLAHPLLLYPISVLNRLFL